jgi:2-keto-4-pentenoate hydratase/2-oxohepta-3-ene-1,7-dioic acid hydratase in catechol pathway
MLNETAALSCGSSFITLEPGELIFTGMTSSPRDAIIELSDTTAVEVENIGSLSKLVDEI